VLFKIPIYFITPIITQPLPFEPEFNGLCSLNKTEAQVVMELISISVVTDTYNLFSQSCSYSFAFILLNFRQIEKRFKHNPQNLVCDDMYKCLYDEPYLQKAGLPRILSSRFRELFTRG